jgi:hypothetical protein
MIEHFQQLAKLGAMGVETGNDRGVAGGESPGRTPLLSEQSSQAQICLLPNAQTAPSQSLRDHHP